MFKWSLLMCLVKFKGPYTELSGRPELNVRHRTNAAAKRAVLCLGLTELGCQMLNVYKISHISFCQS